MIDRVTALKPAIQAVLESLKTLLGLDRPHSYRPEAHYMRGPGPKWRARYGDPQRAVVGRTRSASSRTL